MMKAPFSQARWIGVPEPVGDAHFVFRRRFSLDRKPDAAPIRITADPRDILWVNGKFVGRGPAWGYPFAQPYDEYDRTWKQPGGIEHYLPPNSAEQKPQPTHGDQLRH